MNEMNHDRAIARLTETGFSADQSERLVSVIEDVVTTRTLTKQDLDLAMMAQRGEFNDKLGDLRAEVRDSIGALRTEMKESIGNLRTEVHREIGDLRADFSERLGDTNQKIADLRAEFSRDLRLQTLQMLAGMSAIVGLMLALQKLL